MFKLLCKLGIHKYVWRGWSLDSDILPEGGWIQFKECIRCSQPAGVDKFTDIENKLG
jgi:hypothetical protein